MQIALPPALESEMATPADNSPEKLLTIEQASFALGLPYWQLQRAVKRKLIPSYAPFNSRKLVLLSELRAFVQRTRTGGEV